MNHHVSGALARDRIAAALRQVARQSSARAVAPAAPTRFPPFALPIVREVRPRPPARPTARSGDHDPRITCELARAERVPIEIRRLTGHDDLDALVHRRPRTARNGRGRCSSAGSTRRPLARPPVRPEHPRPRRGRPADLAGRLPAHRPAAQPPGGRRLADDDGAPRVPAGARGAQARAARRGARGRPRARRDAARRASILEAERREALHRALETVPQHEQRLMRMMLQRAVAELRRAQRRAGHPEGQHRPDARALRGAPAPRRGTRQRDRGNHRSRS